LAQFTLFTTTVLALGLASAGTAESSKVYRWYADRAAVELDEIPFRIVYETRRSGNWEIFIINADGSAPENLTKTPDVSEMYPKVSPAGDRIAFVADVGKGRKTKRNLYLMNLDGTGRTLVAKNGRQPCWSPDGKRLAFVKSEYAKFSARSWATKGLYFYDLATEKTEAHSNEKLSHLYSLSWSPDGAHILATVHGAMGISHGDLAIEVSGTRYFELGISGCRPEFTNDGARILWHRNDHLMKTAAIDWSRNPPVAREGKRDLVACSKKYKVYHGDWSPDGKYVIFTFGPNAGGQAVGKRAPGWDLCVLEVATGKWVKVTDDGLHNKEPDWVPPGP